MKKKLLAVMLALVLVLAFSSVAMAADFEHFSVDPGAGAAIVPGDGNKATVYAAANEVTLTFTMAEGYSIRFDGESNDSGIGVVTHKISGEQAFNVGLVDTGNSDRVYYTFSLQKVEASIESANLYKDAAGTAKYPKSGSGFMVPTGVKYVYVKITPPEGVDYTVEGAGKPNSDGYAAVSISDTTKKFTVAVKVGGETFASQEYTLLPLLADIYFNDEASASGRNTLPIERGTDEYSTKDGYVESGWNPVYFKPNATDSDAKITVYRNSTKLNDNNGWYSQRMSLDVYELTIEVSVGEGKDAVSQEYTVYLMGEDYEGPTVKSFEANELSTGRGDDYITVVDQESKTIYVFLPENASKFYANVIMDGDVNKLKLGSTAIEEGKWYSASTSTSQLTYEDEAGLEYKYTISVVKGNKKYDDATLKSLTVKSGSRANTADVVNIGFDKDVLDYAFERGLIAHYLCETFCKG